MCMKIGEPARPARGPCNESHQAAQSNWTVASTANISSTTIATNTGGLTWVLT